MNLYPEGTRIKPNKLAKAQEFAQQNGHALPQHVLIPRVRGFQATLDGLEGHLQAVYDLTIVYESAPPTIWELLSGQGCRVKLDVKRFAIEQLPKDQEGRGAWLLELFRQKDQHIAQLKRQF